MEAFLNPYQVYRNANIANINLYNTPIRDKSTNASVINSVNHLNERYQQGHNRNMSYNPNPNPNPNPNNGIESYVGAKNNYSRFNSPVSFKSDNEISKIVRSNPLYMSSKNIHARHTFKMGEIEDQYKSVANKRQQERNNLLDIINKQIVNSSNISKISNYNNSSLNDNSNNNILYNSPLRSSIRDSARKSVVINEPPRSEKVSRRTRSTIKDTPEVSNFNAKEFDESSSPSKRPRNRQSSYALDEVKDNLELFKNEISSQMKQLQRSQRKFLNNDEIMDEISEFKTMFRNKMNKEGAETIHELKQLKQNFSNLQEEIFEIADNFHKKEQNMGMNSEIAELKNEMKTKIEEMEKKQKKQMNGLKQILETTGDKRTKELAHKLLEGEGENHQNLEKNVYLKPDSRELNEAIEHEKSRMLKLGGRESVLEEEQIKKLIEKTKKKNQHLSEEALVDEGALNKMGHNAKELLKAVNKRMSKYINLQEDQVQMKKINHFRKYVHIVMICHRFTKFRQTSKQTQTFNSLVTFTREYYACDQQLKNFINDSVKVSFQSIINLKGVQMDITYKSITNSFEDTEIRDKYIKLEARLKGVLDNLIQNTTKDRIPPHLLAYLKLIITNEIFIPFKFFSLFEIARCDLSKDPEPPNCYLINIKERHSSMILCFYILIKILAKHILFELNYLSLEKKQDIYANGAKNFKIVASIIFCETVELFKQHCPLINKIRNFGVLCNYQTCFISDKSKGLIDLSLIDKKKTSKSYLEALKKYVVKKKTKNQFNADMAQKEKEVVDKFNKRFAYAEPDSDLNNIEFIQNCFYKTSDLDTYYLLAKENKFDLKVKIFIWVKQLIKILKE